MTSRRDQKMVRDRTPEVDASVGLNLQYRVAATHERLSWLERKLVEEVGEYLQSGEVEELADIMEVLFALGEEHETTVEELDAVRRHKREQRGGFDMGWIWYLEWEQRD